MRVAFAVLMLLAYLRIEVYGFSDAHFTSNAQCVHGGPQGPITGINTYCTLTIPQWVSSSIGCSSFTSSLEFYNSQETFLGQVTLFGQMGQGFYLNVSNSAVGSMAIYPDFPSTVGGFDIILQYSHGMFQLSSVSQSLTAAATTTTFAYAIPPWGLEVYGVRAASSGPTSSIWVLAGCVSSTTLNVEPYVPSAYLTPLPCTPLPEPQPCLATPLTNGGVAYVTVYPSMSGSCTLGLFFDVVIPDASLWVMSIFDGLDGNQTIYWQDSIAYNGPAFIDKYQPTIVWFLVNAAGYMFVGTGDPNHGLNPITALPDPLTLGSTSMFYACSRTSDWTVSDLDWMSVIESCEGIPSVNLNGGQTVTFNYTLTNKDPLSACSVDLAAVLLEASSEQGYTIAWVTLPSATNAIVHLQDVFNTPRSPLTCTWSTPLSSQSYVTYGCLDDACFSIFVVIGAYMNSLNNTIIYVPLCNVSVLDAYIGGFRWNVLGSSVTNPQVLPYLPIPTYAPLTTTSTTTTSNNPSRHDPIISNFASGVGMLVSIVLIALLSGAICYMKWNSKHNKDEYQPILPK